MPTITHIFKTYFPDTQGGLEEAIRQIGKYSVLKGFDVNVISISDNPGKKVLDGLNCRSFKYSCGFSTMPISFDLWRHFDEIIEKTDIVQLHYPFPYAEMLTLLHKIKKPIIVTFHAEIEGRPFLLKCYRPLISHLFRKVDIIVPTSANLVRSISILQKFKDKTHPINLWLDNERFDTLPDVTDEFKMEVDKFSNFALFVGVLRWYKGLDILFDAAKTVKGNIVIVGKGPEMDHLLMRKEREGLDNIFLLGYQSDANVAYLFKKCRFFVLPSQTKGECFGQVLLEASHYKKAMISTELGTGTSLANRDGLTGFVIPPSDSIQLSNKMNYLFENKEHCTLLGLNAYKYSNSNFTKEIHGQKYVDLYEELLKKR